MLDKPVKRSGGQGQAATGARQACHAHAARAPNTRRKHTEAGARGLEDESRCWTDTHEEEHPPRRHGAAR